MVLKLSKTVDTLYSPSGTDESSDELKGITNAYIILL